MKCSKCGSENVTVQLTAETNLKQKHHGVIWWLCIGWWWLPFKWLFLTLPALIVKIFSPKKYKTKTITKKNAVCHACGHSWIV